MNRIAALEALLLLLLTAATAAAVNPVDDFERGDFSFSSSLYEEHVVAIPAYTGHAVHSSRKIILEGVGDPVSASNTASTPFADRALTVTPSATGTVRIHWEWNHPRDLTVLGTVDRFDVVVGDSPPGGQITAILTDAGGGEGVTLPTTGGLETLTFHLSDWSFVDPTQAETIGFRFGSGDDPYYVSEIRFRRSGSLDVDLVGDFVATQIPPIPSPPLRFHTLDETSNPLFQTDMVFQNAVAGGPVEVNATWEAQPGAAGDRGEFEFRWNELGVFTDTFFQLSFDFAPTGGPTPMVYPPDPVLDDPTGFALPFQVALTDGGTVLGMANTLLLFDVDPAQGAEFPSVSVSPRTSAPGTTVTGFDLSFDLVGTSGVEVYEPLFHATWVSEWVPAAITGVVDRGSPAVPRLVAVPSVTRGETELRARSPFPTGARIGVYDVAGRLLQSLVPPDGGRFLRWDGTDASGRSLPGGVYFLRLEGEAGAVTRVTRLR